jgi:hypothetical protein
MRTSAVAGTLLLGLTLSPASVAAPNACGDTYVSAQKLRGEGRLLAARGALTACVRACSGTFREECSGWLSEVSARVPSIVIRALDRDGNDITDVSVAVDGEQVASTLDGKPVELEVGRHKVVLARAGKTVEREVVGADGETRRGLIVQFEPPRKAAASGKGVANAPRSGPSPWVFFGGGGVLVAAGSVFALLAATTVPDSRCAAPCFKTAEGSTAANPDLTHAEDAYQRANTFSWVSTVAIGAGLLGVAIGAYIAITSKAPPRSMGVSGLGGTF